MLEYQEKYVTYSPELPWFEDLWPDERLLAIKEDGNAIKFMETMIPSSQERIAAVTQNGWAIEFIYNPTGFEIRTAMNTVWLTARVNDGVSFSN